ncbi:MAG: cyclic pyranopterin monophosphate synthase MoaC [Desulfobacterales bacterium]
MQRFSVATLTVYDMCKSYDREMTVSDICLLEKSGPEKARNLCERGQRAL